MLTGFYAYSSRLKETAEAIELFIGGINKQSTVRIRSWRDLDNGGQKLIAPILKAIDECDFFIADITDSNVNVLYELGYAVGKQKQVFITRDSAREGNAVLPLLATVGYFDSMNSTVLKEGFDKAFNAYGSKVTLFASIIEPTLEQHQGNKLFYVPLQLRSEPDTRVSAAVASSQLAVIKDDPQEPTIDSLGWFGGAVYNSTAVLCHFSNAELRDSARHNAKVALVAGLGKGFNKPVLAISNKDFASPLDIRDELVPYTSATSAGDLVSKWLDGVKSVQAEYVCQNVPQKGSLKALRQIRIGEPVAENEEQQLSDYFVETAEFRSALAGNTSLVIGRKGSGKSANMLKMAEDLRRNAQNLVVVIKPSHYDVGRLVETLDRYNAFDSKGYAVSALWKSLLYTELARAELATFKDKHRSSWNSEQEKLEDFLGGKLLLADEEFGIRLEKLVMRLLSLPVIDPADGIERSRMPISEALHDGLLAELRQHLGPLLNKHKRVVLLIDNLDQAWDASKDLSSLAQFFVGLLDILQRVGQDFRDMRTSRHSDMHVGICVFMRADVFHVVSRYVAENDKLFPSRLSWNSKEALLRVLVERLSDQTNQSVLSDPMWGKYFCPMVEEMPVQDYIYSCILPRPRDLLTFIKEAVAIAVNKNHQRIEAEDMLEARKHYGDFLIRNISVEYQARGASFQEILYQLLGEPAIITRGTLEEKLRGCSVPDNDHDHVIDELLRVSFLGINTRNSHFAFPDDDVSLQKFKVLASKASSDAQSQLYQINRPFWQYLELDRDGKLK